MDAAAAFLFNARAPLSRISRAWAVSLFRAAMRKAEAAKEATECGNAAPNEHN